MAAKRPSSKAPRPQGRGALQQRSSIRMGRISRRGRPRNVDQPRVAAADESIGETVYRLSLWGFPLRGPTGILEVVGMIACRLRIRDDGAGLPLGPDRVEQVYEAWRERHTSRMRVQPQPARILSPRRRYAYTAASLRRDRPYRRSSLGRYATVLLLSRGKWQPKAFALADELPGNNDLDITPRWAKELAQFPRLVSGKRGK